MIYCIGDVHGEAEALREMLGLLPVEPSDLLVLLGDIINRGPASFDCVEQVLGFDRCRKVFVQGNHEEAMLAYLEMGDASTLMSMGGQATLDSYARAGYAAQPGVPDTIPPAHAQLYAQALGWTLPFYITPDYIFTHAGWNISLPLERQSPDAMRWGGLKGQEASVWAQTIVRGHVPFPKVMFARRKGYVGVDTGCGRGGLLSAVALPSEQVWTVRPASFRPDWYTHRRSTRHSY